MPRRGLACQVWSSHLLVGLGFVASNAIQIQYAPAEFRGGGALGDGDDDLSFAVFGVEEGHRSRVLLE